MAQGWLPRWVPLWNLGHELSGLLSLANPSLIGENGQKKNYFLLFFC